MHYHPAVEKAFVVNEMQVSAGEVQRGARFSAARAQIYTNINFTTRSLDPRARERADLSGFERAL